MSAFDPLRTADIWSYLQAVRKLAGLHMGVLFLLLGLAPASQTGAVILALAALGVFTAPGQADGSAMPNADQVRAALLAHLNTICGETSDQCHHPFGVTVRRVRCSPRTANRVRCRFDERMTQFHIRRPRWHRVAYEFVYDPARYRWSMDCRIEPTQNAGSFRTVCS